MGQRVKSDKVLTGMGVADRRVGLDTLTDVGVGGAASADSAYTQVGGGPGQAVSDDELTKLTLEISNGLEVPFEMAVRTAGLPGREDLGILWREQSSTTEDDWRGKNPPQMLDRWAAVRWSDALVFRYFDLIVQKKSQQIACVSATDLLDSIKADLFDWNTSTWATGNTVSVDPTIDQTAILSTWLAITSVVLQSDRALVIGVDSLGVLRVFASDDLVEWSPYANDAGSAVLTTIGATAALYRGDVLLVIDDNVGFRAQQFSSNDLGTNFTEVETTLNIGDQLHARALPNKGGIIVAYRESNAGRPAFRILSSAAQPLSTATEVLIDDTIGAVEAVTQLGLEVDDNGGIYVICRPAGGGSLALTTDTIVVWTSLDGGVTWALQSMVLYKGGLSTTSPIKLQCRFCRGWMVTAHGWAATVGNEGGSIGTMWSSGWTNRLDGFWEQTWIPLDLPADIGPWVNAGATLPTLAPPGVMQFVVAASTGYVELDPSQPEVYFDHRIDSGTPGLAALDNGVALRWANGVSTYRIQIRIGAAATRLYDTGAGAPIGGDTALDGTVWRQWSAVINSLGLVYVFYRDEMTTRWVVALYAHQLTDTGATAATNRIRVGSPAATTVTSQWRRLDNGKGDRGIGLRLATGGLTNAIQTGAPLTSLPNAVPELGGSDPAVADLLAGTATAPLATYLAAVRGSGRRGERFTVDPFYERGVDSLFPRLSPSPSEPFEALDTSELRFVFDLDDDTKLGDIWHRFLGLFGVNFQSAVVEGSNNGTSWTTLGTYNGAAGFEGLSYTRVGNIIRPAPGTIAGARFLGKGVLAPYGTIADRAGFLILDTGGTPVARPVVSNGPGVWDDPTPQNTLYAEVRIGGDAASVPTSGTCDLVFPDGVMLCRVPGVFPSTSQFYRWVRVRVPAAQTIVGDGYKIGAMVGPGSVAIFGKAHSRGWTQGMTPNTSTRRSRFGVRRRRQLGPSPRRWSINWADGTVLTKIYETDSPDFLAAGAASAALAGVDDVWWSLWGLLEETDGWSAPVVLLNAIQNSLEYTETDRTKFLFAHVDEGAVQATETTGDIGVDAVVRIDAIAGDESV